MVKFIPVTLHTTQRLLLFILVLGGLTAAAEAQSSLSQSTAPRRAGVVPPAAPSAVELAGAPKSAAALPSTVAWKQLRAGKSGGKPPRARDVVFFRAIGRRPDGTVVQNGFESPEPQKSLVNKLFPAWQEALSGMVEGEQRRFWFPAALTPKNSASGAQTPLVFDVELERIGRMPEPPAFVAKPDPKAAKVGLGTSVLTVSPGTPGASLTRADGALLEFTIWNSLGQALSSSIADGRPTLFPLDRVMSSFADCLLGMTVGEKRHCWIPAARNEGFPGAGKGALVFEVELTKIVDTDALFGGQLKPGGAPK